VRYSLGLPNFVVVILFSWKSPPLFYAIAAELKSYANPVIISMASGVVEVPKIAGVKFEYVPGRDRKWMGRFEWDRYLRDRIVSLIDETNAKIVSFDGVVPYPGIIGIKSVRPDVKLVWVRRGFWQKTPQRYLLNLQSKMMDLIITPGDFGQSYDKGPTSTRNDSVLVKRSPSCLGAIGHR